MTTLEMDREAFRKTLSERTEKINEELLRFLPEETGMQRIILEACNYSVENGGKRIRPILMETAYFLCKRAQEEENGGQQDGESDPGAFYLRYREEYETLLAPFLAAIEMIHSSSLVHDDLPCMDNDSLRRGKPSTWAKFGEDMGTLAGDGLMIYAFETACKAMEETKLRECGTAAIGERALRVVRAIGILAQKTGIFGMIGGQTVDVALTGKTPDEEELDFIYRLKTGALLEASTMIGAVLAGAGDAEIETMRLAASELGMAFQIRDDILDGTESSEELGKPAGSDERNRKTTYVTRIGVEKAQAEVESYTESAEKRIREIAYYPFFEMLCAYLTERRK